MSSTAKKTKTVYEEWLEVPQCQNGEIIMGELHVQSRPAMQHANSAGDLFQQLRGPFHKGKNGPGGWVILYEPEIHLENNIFIPDIAGWKSERVPNFLSEVFSTVEPDWVCEVLSPSTARLDTTKKMPLYASLGIKFFWLVDPAARTLVVYKNEIISDTNRWVLTGTFSDAEKIRAAPFEAIEIDLAELWK